jgi:hypothetical protein
VRDRRRLLGLCWEVSDPKPAGRWVLAWTITREGTVRGARVTSSPGEDEAFSRCIVAAVSRLRFDLQPDEVEVAAFPFVFGEE